MKKQIIKIKDHLEEIKLELLTSESKVNMDWIYGLNQLLAKDDALIEVFEKAALINLEFDSVEKICQQHLGGKHRNDFQNVFDLIAKLTVPIDTMNLIAFEYFEQILTANKKVLENKKIDKIRLTGQSFSNLYHSVRVSSHIKSEHNQIKKIVDKYGLNEQRQPMEVIMQTIVQLLMLLQPINDNIQEIKKVLTASNPVNVTERDNIIKKELSEAYETLCNTAYYKELTEWSDIIYKQLYKVNFYHGIITIHINSILPYKIESKPKTFILDWIRMQKIKTRLNTQAKGVNDFIRTANNVPKGLTEFKKYINDVAELPKLFEDDFELITSKTLKHLEYLIGSELSSKKNDSGALGAMREYLRTLPSIYATIKYDSSNKSFYSHMYHTQILMPRRNTMGSSSSSYSSYRSYSYSYSYRETDIEKLRKEMTNATNTLKQNIGTLKQYLDGERRLATTIFTILDELEEELKSDQRHTEQIQKNIEEKLNEIKRHITLQMPKLKNIAPQIKKKQQAIEKWLDKECVSRMNKAFAALSSSLVLKLDLREY